MNAIELNERVAKARNWTYSAHRDEWTRPEGQYYFELPKWSTEIAASEELMDWLVADGWHIHEERQPNYRSIRLQSAAFAGSRPDFEASSYSDNALCENRCNAFIALTEANP